MRIWIPCILGAVAAGFFIAAAFGCRADIKRRQNEEKELNEE